MRNGREIPWVVRATVGIKLLLRLHQTPGWIPLSNTVDCKPTKSHRMSHHLPRPLSVKSELGRIQDPGPQPGGTATLWAG